MPARPGALHLGLLLWSLGLLAATAELVRPPPPPFNAAEYAEMRRARAAARARLDHLLKVRAAAAR